MAHDSKRIKMEPTATTPHNGSRSGAAPGTGSAGDTKPVLIAGIDATQIARLPREALVDIVLQTLPTSTALQAIVLQKLQHHAHTLDGAGDAEVDEEATEDEDVSDDYEDVSDDADSAADGAGVGGVGGAGGAAAAAAGDGIDDAKLPPACRGLGLSALSKLIMEVMSSAPAPEGGMPWREFEGIWPPVLGTVQAAVDELKSKGLLIAVDAAGEFVESTVPIDPEAVLE